MLYIAPEDVAAAHAARLGHETCQALSEHRRHAVALLRAERRAWWVALGRGLRRTLTRKALALPAPDATKPSRSVIETLEPCCDQRAA